MFNTWWFYAFLIIQLTAKGSSYSRYGEPCTNNDECNDHRLMCSGDGKSLGICICDRYHKLINGAECVQVYNTSSIMQIEVTRLDARDLETIIESYNETVFRIQLGAGMFVAAVCGLTVVAVMIYCYFVRVSDRALKKSVKAMMKSKSKPLECADPKMV